MHSGNEIKLDSGSWKREISTYIHGLKAKTLYKYINKSFSSEKNTNTTKITRIFISDNC